tara:strand:+ start:4954 stop:6279 length:1326 start_codon:yes stop_codon:yes gene_type:complete
MNSQSNISKFFFGYGIAIFPLLLLIGPLISELFLISIIIFSTFYVLREKKVIYFKNRFFIFFLLFYLSTVYSTLLNFYNLDNSLAGLFYFRIPLFAFSVWYILNNFNIFNKKTIIFYNLFFLLIIFDALLQFYSGKNLLGDEIIAKRISSFFGEELVLGGFIIRILPIFLIYLVMNNFLNKEKSNIYYLLLISFLCFVVYLSGERTSFALLILFFFTLFFISKYLRKSIIIITITSLILSFVLPNFKNSDEINPANRMFTKSYNQIIGKGEEQYEKHKKKIFKKLYIFSHDHHGHYMLSYRIFKDHKIFGTGTKGFRYLCRNKIYTIDNPALKVFSDGCSTHPHNTYAQILVSNGLIGFFLLTFAFFYILKEIFLCRKKIKGQTIFDKNEISKAIAISAIFINIWPLIPSGNFFNNWLSMLYFYPIGFYLYFKHINEKKIS